MNDLIESVENISKEVQHSSFGNRLKILVPVDKISEVARVVNNYGFDHIESVCGTDYPETENIEVTYFIGSLKDKFRNNVVILGSRVSRDNPTLPSLINIWPGSNFHEREQWEMLGVKFEGHPRLERLLLPDDWDDIPPLRKDFNIKKWGLIERDASQMILEKPVQHSIFQTSIPSKEDFKKVRNPKSIQTFQSALSNPEVDVLGKSLFDIVQKDDKTLAISFGIQHPGSGHLRLVLGLDGDIVKEVEPDIGYVHRGEEKMCEYKNYLQNIPHLERPAIHDSAGVLFPYILAAEELLDLTDKIPERAQYLRIIMAEFNRILSHQYWLGIQGIFTGHSTMFMWAMGDRELIMDAVQQLGGARVTFSYFVPGGVRNDSPPGFEEYVRKVCDKFEKRLDQYKKMYFENPIFLTRTKDVGTLSNQDAISLGAVGPTLRASNVKSDIRKDEPYSLYDTLDFDIPIHKEGDSYARCLVSYLEMYESLKIIRQAIDKLKPGPLRVAARGRLRGKEGEAYARTEAAHGSISYYMVSDGKDKPYRVRINTPSFRNLLPIIKKILPGHKVADVPVIHWSLNYWAVEADR